jgi:DNA-binding cell septation regulator SpoVG
MAPEKAKPAGTSGGHRDFLITSWKAHRKNSLQGFLSITLPSGLVVHNCTLHERNGVRWTGLPSRQYAKDDGTPAYAPVVEFSSNDAKKRFEAAALAAIDRFFENQEGAR